MMPTSQPMAAEKPLSDKRDERARKKQVKRLVEAFEIFSKRDPEGFRNIAPKLLRKGIYQTRGSDPFLLTQVDNWLEREWKFHHFSEVLPKVDHSYSLNFTSCKSINPRQFKGEKKDWLLNLELRFTEKWERWDASTKDQFIILGMIASAPEGASQGQLIDRLALASDTSEELKEASNTIRAANIAITRLARKAGIGRVFAKAEGHGRLRQYRFGDEGMREPTARWLSFHPASVLLPSSSSSSSTSPTLSPDA
jgi:hypothetical protein